MASSVPWLRDRHGGADHHRQGTGRGSLCTLEGSVLTPARGQCDPGCTGILSCDKVARLLSDATGSVLRQAKTRWRASDHSSAT
jgi:hypothetical protein